jgi:hypothetical protein
LTQQIQTIRDATVVIGVHGAGTLVVYERTLSNHLW